MKKIRRSQPASFKLRMPMPLALPSGRGRRWIEERTAAGINQPNTGAFGTGVRP